MGSREKSVLDWIRAGEAVSIQKFSLRAACPMRGPSSVPVTRPKVAELKLPEGFPNCAWSNVLKNSLFIPAYVTDKLTGVVRVTAELELSVPVIVIV